MRRAAFPFTRAETEALFELVCIAKASGVVSVAGHEMSTEQWAAVDSVAPKLAAILERGAKLDALERKAERVTARCAHGVRRGDFCSACIMEGNG